MRKLTVTAVQFEHLLIISITFVYQDKFPKFNSHRFSGT